LYWQISGRNSSDKRLKYESSASNYDKEVIQQLNKIDRAACMWSQLTASIDFNIFRGFATERELVDYVLTEAYADNVTVVASKFGVQRYGKLCMYDCISQQTLQNFTSFVNAVH
jgi:hypothetical protein